MKRSAPAVVLLTLIATYIATYSGMMARAQVEVIDSSPLNPRSTSATSTVTDSNNTVRTIRSVPVRPSSQGDSPALSTPLESSGSSQAQLFYQLQTLQQEVLELRGLVEEQAFEIKRLKQQRLDDYLDLDRRLAALSGSGEASAGNKAAPAASSRPGVSAAGSAASQADSEMQTYRKAIDLVLKQKNYDQAISEFNRYLSQYPKGRYAANAHYWLGEIYLLKNDLENARQWFTKLLESFPNHRKAPDAKFKLGKVYHQLGDDAKARALLKEAAESGTDAARLARNYLKENF